MSSLRIYVSSMIVLSALLHWTNSFAGSGAEPTTIKSNHSDSLVSPAVDGDCPPESIKGNISIACLTHNIGVRFSSEGAVAEGVRGNFTDGSITLEGASVVDSLDDESALYWFGPGASPDFLMTEEMAQIRFNKDVLALTFSVQVNRNVPDVNVGQMLFLNDAGSVIGNANVSFTRLEPSGMQAITVDLRASRPFRSVILQSTPSWLIGNLSYQSDF